MGHSIGEMNWDDSIPSLKANSFEAGSINLGGVSKINWPSLVCTTVTKAGNGATIASCLSGYTLTGGGCWWDNPNLQYRFSMPNGNSWYCDSWAGLEPVTVYAQCCKIN